ncbi:MAG: methyltransferase domain-containing protein [Planctomycetia bacterium]|nr:methyltransferase domain-containing protein [Planctomycetia bacterium]
MEDEYKSAKYYDKFLYLFVRRIRNKILKIVKENQYKNILDVCCGTGNQLKLLKKHRVDGVGIDLSKAMLKVAKSGKIKANCSEQDAENINFNDESFDMTMTTFALHEKSNSSAKKILNEMIRLTKKNGHLIIVDFSINKNTLSFARKGISFIESRAGDDHFKYYSDYVSSNGLDTLLKGSPLKEIEKYYFAFNGVVLKVLVKL